MFTGIIQNIAVLEKVKAVSGQRHFLFRWIRPEAKVQLGESVAVNGVCLTVARHGGQAFQVDVIRETLEATTLGQLEAGDRIHTERALRFGDPLGGHFISGHVDGRGEIRAIRRSGKNYTIEVAVPKSLKKYMVTKGSVGIDGVSLTIQKLTKTGISIGLVPHTLKETTLGDRKKGDGVNIEVDLMARCLIDSGAASRGRQNKPLKMLWALLQNASARPAVSYLKSQGF